MHSKGYLSAIVKHSITRKVVFTFIKDPADLEIIKVMHRTEETRGNLLR